LRRFTSNQETTRFGVTFLTENKVDFEDKPKFSGVTNPVLGPIVDRFSRARLDLPAPLGSNLEITFSAVSLSVVSRFDPKCVFIFIPDSPF
jgi:hypothetical protein